MAGFVLFVSGASLTAELYPQARVEVTATLVAPAPEGFVLIPAGSFEMGDHFEDGWSSELPVHTVYVSDFIMGQFQVTKAQWDALRSWAMDSGYTDLPDGGGKGPDHPVHSVNWFDAVKWLNAWSEKDGLEPVYRVNGTVMRTGSATPVIDYSANGYRLPTEAEWEKAARGDLSGQRFPWGDTISQDDANYRPHGSGFSYDVSPNTTLMFHPSYNDGTTPYTSPVGSFAPNGFELYDMAGNVSEWCNDWPSSTYYSESPSVDPRGPSSGSGRVIRGGDWNHGAIYARVSSRPGNHPDSRGNTTGFRPVRGLVDSTSPARVLDLFGNLDFGMVEIGQSTTRLLRITNAGDEPLTVTATDYPNGFDSDWTGGTIDAQSALEVTVTFSPATEQVYGGTITVESDATKGANTHPVSGTGVVASREIVLSGNLDFGEVTVGYSTTRLLRLANAGNQPLTVAGIGYPDGFSGDWSGGTIASGGSREVTVTFSPVAEQVYDGTFAVDSDATSGEATIEATGAGVAGDPALEGFVLIPAGSFEMGDHFEEGSSNELPVHTVDVSAFYMGRTPVTKAQWDAVRVWAVDNGYTGIPGGGGIGPDHPVQRVSWLDAVKWLNAWSEKDGLAPVYRVNGAVMRSENYVPTAQFSANGYRLPTEAEWEKAARGGLKERRFPWGDTISHDNANYRANGSAFTYDVSPYTSATYHPSYVGGGLPYTSPVGSFVVNGYGLYDMAGNVFEWCHDRYSDTYYSVSPEVDPRGPSSGSLRVLRGGSWPSSALFLRVSSRFSIESNDRNNASGFRPVTSADRAPTPVLELSGDLSFGDVTVGQISARILTITNTGNGPLTVTGIDLPNGFSADWTAGTVAIWERREVTVTFSPAAEQVYGGTIAVESDAISDEATIEANGAGVSGGPALEGFALIPAGTFEMGDHFGEGSSSELPVHTVNVSAFYMGRTQVTKAQWDEVRSWAANHGYTDLPVGGGKGPDHPVHSVDWFDAAKWLNAWSEMDGLEPVYRVNGAVMKTGNTTPVIDYASNGYRLPTEAEWEKAARGGLSGQRFPWGDTISHNNANYRAAGGAYTYELSPYADLTYHPVYNDGTFPYTSPVGSFPAYGYGLHDMTGNVWEWCNDWFSSTYYTVPPGQGDPHGPSSGIDRVQRGGAWNSSTLATRVSQRGGIGPGSRNNNRGFRPVLGQTSGDEVVPPESPEERIASFFDLEAAGTVIGGHRLVSPWFGEFAFASGFDMEENQGWLFHNQHGWLYWSGGGWFWRHSQQQWHYMNESIHPFAYVHEIGWFYFYEDSPAFPARQWFSSYREENGEQVPDRWVRWFHHARDDVTAFRLEAGDLAPGVELILTITEDGFEYILAFGEENEVTIAELGEEGSYRYEIIDATDSILDLVLFTEGDSGAAWMEKIHLTFESANEGSYELTRDEEAEDVVEEGRFLFR